MPKGENSFKKLEQEQEEQYADNIKKVKESVDGNMNSLTSLTNIVDMYLSKVFSYIIAMTGGDDTKRKDEDNPKSQEE